MNEPKALATNRERLEYLLNEEAKNSDPIQKFALKKEIEETRIKIAEQEAEFQAAAQSQLPPSADSHSNGHYDVTGSKSDSVLTQPSSKSSRFLRSIIAAKELNEIGLVINPYRIDPTESFDLSVHVHLVVPDPKFFSLDALPDTAIVAICDAGDNDTQRALADHVDPPLTAFYEFPPPKLLNGKKRELTKIIGEVLGGTFIIAAFIPNSFMGRGLKKPEAAYECVLNMVLLPLVAAHRRWGFEELSLTSNVDPAYEKVAGQISKRIIKAGFQRGRYKILQPQHSEVTRFYNYAARYIAWSVNRAQNNNDPQWLSLLVEALKD